MCVIYVCHICDICYIGFGHLNDGLHRQAKDFLNSHSLLCHPRMDAGKYGYLKFCTKILHKLINNRK